MAGQCFDQAAVHAVKKTDAGILQADCQRLIVRGKSENADSNLVFDFELERAIPHIPDADRVVIRGGEQRVSVF